MNRFAGNHPPTAHASPWPHRNSPPGAFTGHRRTPEDVRRGAPGQGSDGPPTSRAALRTHFSAVRSGPPRVRRPAREPVNLSQARPANRPGFDVTARWGPAPFTSCFRGRPRPHTVAERGFRSLRSARGLLPGSPRQYSAHRADLEGDLTLIILTLSLPQRHPADAVTGDEVAPLNHRRKVPSDPDRIRAVTGSPASVPFGASPGPFRPSPFSTDASSTEAVFSPPSPGTVSTGTGSTAPPRKNRATRPLAIRTMA